MVACLVFGAPPLPRVACLCSSFVNHGFRQDLGCTLSFKFPDSKEASITSLPRGRL